MFYDDCVDFVVNRIGTGLEYPFTVQELSALVAGLEAEEES